MKLLSIDVGLKNLALCLFQKEESGLFSINIWDVINVTGVEEQIKQSFDVFEWIKEHPAGFERWKRDRKEKNAVAWFHPRTTRLNPRWCPDIVALYIRHVKGPVLRF